MNKNWPNFERNLLGLSLMILKMYSIVVILIKKKLSSFYGIYTEFFQKELSTNKR